MKILRLTAENFKRLSIVEITPEGAVVEIAGRNAQGKTSVLGAIWAALGGGEALPSEPIRRGEDRARIEVTLGADGEAKYLVERTFTPTASYLTVKSADNAKYAKPQKLLDDLLGHLSFDPLAFMRAKPLEQFETLRGIVDFPVDLAEIDRERAEIFAARTEVNRSAKALLAQMEAAAVDESCPREAIDTAGIIDRLAGIDRHNTEVREATRAVQAAEVQVTRARDNVASIERELARAKKLLTEASADYEAIRHRPIAQLTDPAKIQADLAAANEHNKRYERRQRYEALAAEHAAAEDKAKEHTLHLDAIDLEKREALAAAKMPVEGLAFGDGIVTYRDLPLAQASDAEQLMVSTGIAAALNPKLRVILIRDGSLLDEDSMKWLAGFAEERDLQVWCEVVRSDNPCAVVLEDGHVRGAIQEAAE